MAYGLLFLNNYLSIVYYLYAYARVPVPLFMTFLAALALGVQDTVFYGNSFYNH